DEAAPVHPAALRHPFGQPAVALVVRARRLAGPHEVVEDAARHARGQPPGRVPGLVRADVPAPLVAQAAADLPVVAVEEDHCSSRFVSRTGASRSRGTRTVAISFAPTASSNARSKSVTETSVSRPAVS